MSSTPSRARITVISLAIAVFAVGFGASSSSATLQAQLIPLPPLPPLSSFGSFGDLFRFMFGDQPSTPLFAPQPGGAGPLQGGGTGDTGQGDRGEDENQGEGEDDGSDPGAEQDDDSGQAGGEGTCQGEFNLCSRGKKKLCGDGEKIVGDPVQRCSIGNESGRCYKCEPDGSGASDDGNDDAGGDDTNSDGNVCGEGAWCVDGIHANDEAKECAEASPMKEKYCNDNAGMCFRCTEWKGSGGELTGGDDGGGGDSNEGDGDVGDTGDAGNGGNPATGGNPPEESDDDGNDEGGNGATGIRSCEQPYRCNVSYDSNGKRYELPRNRECGYSEGSRMKAEYGEWCGKNENDGICSTCVRDDGSAGLSDGGTGGNGVGLTGNGGGVSGDGASGGAVNGECSIKDCGPMLGLPNYPCSDGSVGGPTGRCLLKGDRCGWEIRKCPDGPGTMGGGPMQPSMPGGMIPFF